MTLGNTFNSASDVSATCRAKRMVPRYSFIASTELTDAANATRLSGRVTEISRKGCYVDIMNALPVGDELNLRISNDQGTFVAKGKIIYVHERIGMGVVFMDPAKEQLDILDTWLHELPPGAAIA
jgi:PilZ domain-containing protein